MQQNLSVRAGTQSNWEENKNFSSTLSTLSPIVLQSLVNSKATNQYLNDHPTEQIISDR